jgi:hypothetical protein
VAKLVDARDLKSLDFGHTGSTPVVRTKGCARPAQQHRSCSPRSVRDAEHRGSTKEEGMSLDLLAIDLGKQSFHIHGIDSDGVIISRKISRAKLTGRSRNLRRQ